MKYRATALASVLLVPSIALAAAPRTFSELANLLVTILDSAAGLLVVAGIVIYFFGISTSLYKVKSGEDTGKLKTILSWGLIVLFIMVSIWGILMLLQNTLFSGDRYSPSTGQSGATPSFDAPVFTGQ